MAQTEKLTGLVTVATSNTRERVFSAILAANGKQALVEDIDQAFAELTAEADTGYESLRTYSDCVREFTVQADASGAIVESVASIDELPSLMERLIKRPSERLAVAQQSALQNMHLSVELSDMKTATWGLACASAAIAETGTVAVDGREVASELLFLVEYLVLVVPKVAIVARQEQVWRLHNIKSQQRPRAMHLITGPSRTADVEQTLQVGAHGPRQLYVVIVE